MFQKVTEKEMVALIVFMLEQNIDLQFGKISLCDLRNYRYGNVRRNRRYQVHSEDRQYPFSMIYDDPSIAVKKFLFLKQKSRKMH
uniref:Uncharacterized protein n=1 Tax=viral metagenome TaxID=1070528 RepID=A0A6M3IM31_9ZZZZ